MDTFGQSLHDAADLLHFLFKLLLFSFDVLQLFISLDALFIIELVVYVLLQ